MPTAATPIRETPVLFDWLALRRFRALLTAPHAPPAQVLAMLPVIAASAGIAVVRAQCVHWYLEPMNGPGLVPSLQLPLNDFAPLEPGAVMHLVFPSDSAATTRHLTLHLKGIASAHFLSVTPAPAAVRVGASDAVQVSLLTSDARLVVLRARIPHFDGRSTTADIAVDKYITARRAASVDANAIASATKIVAAGNLIFYPTDGAPGVLRVTEAWRGSERADTWKCDVGVEPLLLPLPLMAHFAATLKTWTRANPVTDLALVAVPNRVNRPDRILLAALLPSSSVIHFYDAGISSTPQAFLSSVPLDSIADPAVHGPITSLHFPDLPALSNNTAALPTSVQVAVHTSQTNTFHVFSLVDDVVGTGMPLVVPGSVRALPSAGLPRVPTAGEFKDAAWLAPGTLVVMYTGWDGVGGWVGSISTTTTSLGSGTDNTTQGSSSSSWTPMASVAETQGAGVAAATDRALRRFCREVKLTMPPDTVGAFEGEVTWDHSASIARTLLTVEAVASEFQGGHNRDAVRSYAQMQVDRETRPLRFVRVTSSQFSQFGVRSGSPFPLMPSTPKKQEPSQQLPQIPGMLAIVKPGGVGVLRAASNIEAAVDALTPATYARAVHSLSNAQATEKLSPTLELPSRFLAAWGVAEQLVASAALMQGVTDLDAAIRRGGGSAVVSQDMQHAIRAAAEEATEADVEQVRAVLINAGSQGSMAIHFGVRRVISELERAGAVSKQQETQDPIPAANVPEGPGSLRLPHLLVPLLHDQLMDMQNLARAVIVTAIAATALVPGFRADAREIVAQFAPLFRMPDLVVPAALPFIRLSPVVAPNASVAGWAQGQLAQAIASVAKWTVETSCAFVAAAPASAVRAVIDGYGGDRSMVGGVLDGVHAAARAAALGDDDGQELAGAAIVRALQCAPALVTTASEARVSPMDVGRAAVAALTKHEAARAASVVYRLLVPWATDSQVDDASSPPTGMTADMREHLRASAYAAHLAAHHLKDAVTVLASLHADASASAGSGKSSSTKAWLAALAKELVRRGTGPGASHHDDLALGSLAAPLVGELRDLTPGDDPAGVAAAAVARGASPKHRAEACATLEKQAGAFGVLAVTMHRAGAAKQEVAEVQYIVARCHAAWAAVAAVDVHFGADDQQEGQQQWAALQRVETAVLEMRMALTRVVSYLDQQPGGLAARYVLVQGKETLADQTAVVTYDMIDQELDELAAALQVYNLTGDPADMLALVAPGPPPLTAVRMPVPASASEDHMQVDGDDQNDARTRPTPHPDFGRVIARDPQRLPAMLHRMYMAGDVGRAEEMMRKHGAQVRGATGRDMEWLQWGVVSMDQSPPMV